MYKFFNVLLIIGIILTVFRLVSQLDAFPSFPGDELFDQFSVPSIIILIAGIIGTSVLKPKKSD
ncbi:hypothetical protein [Geomicrobium sp. JCM 19055]|uniref:hypothetical protein n=1 Tax=Geomicrobium sp. JCM 19055 TaxID=1460649 RepID=UPI00045EDE36|nr:hypothetical protein [Geomicrobium sp. JCM 19055]GAJ99497.1 hypothetical protein JCM19055_2500 [Geomicrobium sp. JCM 19055]